jgi:hypothetical protein
VARGDGTDARVESRDDLLQRVRERAKPETAVLDKGYDVAPVYDACDRADVLPVIPLRKTGAVKKGSHKPPMCEHGVWKFAGADYTRKVALHADWPAPRRC